MGEEDGGLCKVSEQVGKRREEIENFKSFSYIHDFPRLAAKIF
jgi:hypothetical protein